MFVRKGNGPALLGFILIVIVLTVTLSAVLPSKGTGRLPDSLLEQYSGKTILSVRDENSRIIITTTDGRGIEIYSGKRRLYTREIPVD